MKTPVLLRRAARLSRRAAIVLGITFGAGLLQTSQAAPIEVNNHSFERATYQGANSWTNDMFDPDQTFGEKDWVGRDGQSNGGAFIERIGGFVSEGAAHVGLQGGYYIYQNLGIPYEANTKYTLTVGVGNRNDGFTPVGSLSTIGLAAVPTASGDPLDFDNFIDSISAPGNFAIDTNDADLLAFETVDSEALTPNSSFEDVVVEFETGAAPPNGNITIFLGDDIITNRSHYDNVRLDAVSALDPDGDGLPSDWESANGLNPNSSAGDDGAAGDPDGDDSPNSEEFARGTDPQNEDTDDDGAKDGHEDLTGIFASATSIGTDPLNPDTDGDDISDGHEVDPAFPPFNADVTDPNLPDSDGDEFEDRAELIAGSDPNEAGSVPALTGEVIVGLNIIGGRVTDLPDFPSGTSVTAEAGVVPQENWNNLADLGGRGITLNDSAGTDTIMRVEYTTDDVFTILADPDLPSPGDGNSQLMQGYMKTRNGVPTQVTVRNFAFPSCDVYVYVDASGFDGISTYTCNGQTVALVNDVDDWDILAGTSEFVEVTNDGGEGNYLVFRDVAGPTITVTAVNEGPDFRAPINGLQLVRSTADVDGDGLLDLWEARWGLSSDPATGAAGPNGAAGNPDGDGLTNAQEQDAGTDPTTADTDGDGLNDDEDLAAGTNPLVADTDGDGRSDGDEVNGVGGPATDPNDDDSDDDGFNDQAEIAAGTDPNNAGSVPNIRIPIGYWSFDDGGAGGTTADQAGNNDGTLQGPFALPVAVPGRSGAAGDQALYFDSFEDNAVTTELSMDNLSEVTMAGWIRMQDPYDPAALVIQGDRTGLFGQNDANEMGFSTDGTMAWWMTGGPGQIEFDVFDINFEEWVHVAVVGDSAGRRFYLNGENIADRQSNGTDATIAFPQVSSGFLFNIGGGGIWDATGNPFWGQMDDVAIWDVALIDAEIEALAAGDINPLGQNFGGGGGGGDGFVVTAITRDAITGEVSITFASEEGVDYALDVWNSTTGAWDEVDDATGLAGETSFTGVDGSAPTSIYRVRKID